MLYEVITQLVREVFGFETKIRHNPCSKPAEEMAAPLHETETPLSEPVADNEPEMVEEEERPAYMESYTEPSYNFV